MEHILSLSYGKDSLACLGAIQELGWPLDRIIHSEVWATETIPADLPPMVEFKEKADRIIQETYGIKVEHIRANTAAENEMFFKVRTKGKRAGQIVGFPMIGGCELQKPLKVNPLKEATKNAVQYVGIAFDEPGRFGILSDLKRSPLVVAKWTEEKCRKWCEENNLLSPIYNTMTRGGCWFCPNQSVNQLRLLRKDWPDLWKLLLRWDIDSPVTFKPDGRTVHDFELRFQMEDAGQIPTDRTFRWEMLDKPPKFIAENGEQISLWRDI